jgi:hypothetical protein
LFETGRIQERLAPVDFLEEFTTVTASGNTKIQESLDFLFPFQGRIGAG